MLSHGIVGERYAEAASFNKQINYQGKLTNSSNVAVADGTYHMMFNLYTSLTGGSSIWTEDRSTNAGDRVTISNGLFSVMLGSSTSLANVDFNQPLYLGVEIGGSSGSPAWDGEMTPRKVLGTVPAAFEADKVDGLSSEQFLRSDAVNSTSTATTFLTVTQTGAGRVAEFYGTDAAPAFSILSNGNVGVGTSSPFARLSVGGNAFIGGNLTATGTLAVSGAATLSSTLNVTGATTLSSTLNVAGVTTLATSLNGPLQANAGVVSATSSVGVLYGGTGLTSAPAYGNLLVGNSSGGYTLTATSSLGITLSGLSGTLGVNQGGTGATSFGQGWLYSPGGTSALAASTSPTVNYLTATSTTATSSFAYDVSVTGVLKVSKASSNSTIIGNVTGNTRGTNSLDIQSARNNASEVASGNSSVAVGSYNSASGSIGGISVAVGGFNTVSALGDGIATAFGYGNVAEDTTTAVGNFNISTGVESVAFGIFNKAYGSDSAAIGLYNIAANTNTAALGYRNYVYGVNSAAVGNFNFGNTFAGVVAMGLLNNQTGGTLNLTTGAVSGTATGTATIGRLSSAVGILNTVSGNFGQAFGLGNTVSVTGGAAFGSFINNSVASSTQIGSGDSSKIVIRGDTGYEGFTGIGTSSPFAKLSVAGGAYIGGNLTATGTLAVSGATTLSSTLNVTGLSTLSSLTLGTLNGPLQANAGVVSATSSIGVLYGGTGLTTAPTYGQLLVGNASGGYTLTATSSLGISSGGSSPWTTVGSDIYYSTGNVGIGTSSPFARFSLAGDAYIGGNIVATGTLALKKDGTLATIIGDVTGKIRGTDAVDIQGTRNDVNQVASGAESLALGARNTAYGVSSSAIGVENISTVSDGIAIGNYNSAAFSSVAIGLQNTANGTGNNAIAIGISNSAEDTGIAIGNFNYAGADHSLGIGLGNIIFSGDYTSAFGIQNILSGATDAGAFGYTNSVSGNGSYAFGSANSLSGNNEFVFGFNNSTSFDNTSTFGQYIINNIASSTQIGSGDLSKLTIRGDTGYEGFVGIGTDAPSRKLHVIGDGAGSMYQAMYENTTGGGTAGFALKNNGWEIRFRTNPNNGWFEITDSANNIQHRWNGQDYLLASGGIMGWSSESNFATTQVGGRDTTLYRNSAGVLRTGGGFIADGNVGIGTTTPYAKLSVINNSNTLPQLFVGTSTAGDAFPLLYVSATTTGAMDWARVAIGTTTNSGNAGLRDQFVVSGRIYSTWRELRCDEFGANIVSGTSADTPNVCGQFSIDSDSDGGMVQNTGSNPGYGSLRAGNISGAASGEGVYLRTWNKVTAVQNNPVIEAFVRTAAPLPNTLYLVGFSDDTAGSADAATEPANGVYFAATSTTWKMISRVSSSYAYYVDTGIATSSTDFQKLRIEVSAKDAVFLINNNVVGTVSSSGNLPSSATVMAPVIQLGVQTTANSTLRTFDISYIKVWIDDPSNEDLASEPGFANLLLNNTPDYDGISGANIASAYLTRNAAEYVPGSLVSISTDGGFMVDLSTKRNDRNLLGVVAESVQQVLGVYEGDVTAVAIAGRAPVTVNNLNGQIRVGDPITSSDIPGVGMKATASGFIIGRAIENVAQTGTSTATSSVMVSLNPGYYAGNALVTDEKGNVGIGTTSAQYKLNIVGDARAMTIAAFAGRSGMKNVQALGDTDYAGYLEKIKTLNLSTFNYLSDTGTTTRLGIIGDNAPTEILTASGDVDIYKLASFTLGGVKAQQLKIDSLEARIAAVEEAVALGVTGTSTPATGGIVHVLETLGVRISEGFAYFKNLFAENLTVGTPEKPTGITLYDDVTGEPFCLKVSNGKMKNLPGTCEDNAKTSQEDDSKNDTPDEPVPNPTPTPNPAPTPDPTIEQPPVISPDEPAAKDVVDTGAGEGNSEGQPAPTPPPAPEPAPAPGPTPAPSPKQPTE